MTTPAERLNAAAQRLRELAQGARPFPWKAPRSVPNPSVRTERGSEIAFMTYADDQATADYIAAMHPGVALAIADLLTEIHGSMTQERRDEIESSTEDAALTIADAILAIEDPR